MQVAPLGGDYKLGVPKALEKALVLIASLGGLYLPEAPKVGGME